MEHDEKLAIVLVHFRSLPEIENIFQGQRVNSKMQRQLLKKFRITETIDIYPAYLVIFQAGQQIIIVSILCSSKKCASYSISDITGFWLWYS